MIPLSMFKLISQLLYINEGLSSDIGRDINFNMENDSDAAEIETPQISRKLYSLPTELIVRITAYQQRKNLSSEVEAVRRLLDIALKGNETHADLCEQIVKQLEAGRDYVEAASSVLPGHPKVASVEFDDDAVVFKLRNKKTEINVRIESRTRIFFSNDPDIALRLESPEGMPPYLVNENDSSLDEMVPWGFDG